MFYFHDNRLIVVWSVDWNNFLKMLACWCSFIWQCDPFQHNVGAGAAFRHNMRFFICSVFAVQFFHTASAYRLYRHYSYSWPYIRPKFCIEFLKNKSIQLSESDLSKASWSLQSFPSCVHPLLLAGWLATLPAEISALIQPQPFSIVNKLYIE